MSAVLAVPAARALRQRSHWSDRVAHGALLVIALALVAFLALPLATILAKALQDKGGAFVGLANFASYLGTPALLQSFVNSVWVAALVTVVTVPLAFGFAYALSRSCIPAKGMFRTIALIPLLAPTLLSAISLIYWFGNQGIAKGFITALGFENIYGAPGSVMVKKVRRRDVPSARAAS